MTYQGIIFDFNGVLLWDAEWQLESWQVIATRLRGREMTGEELEREMHGRPNAHVLSYLAGRPLTGKSVPSCAAANTGCAVPASRCRT
jgi:phosphoglycolate phosphatase-like HAD superfamily hydrolase